MSLEGVTGDTYGDPPGSRMGGAIAEDAPRKNLFAKDLRESTRVKLNMVIPP